MRLQAFGEVGRKRGCGGSRPPWAGTWGRLAGGTALASDRRTPAGPRRLVSTALEPGPARNDQELVP